MHLNNLENLQIPIGPYTEAKIIQLQQSDFVPKRNADNSHNNNNYNGNHHISQGGITNLAYEESNTTHL